MPRPRSTSTFDLFELHQRASRSCISFSELLQELELQLSRYSIVKKIETDNRRETLTENAREKETLRVTTTDK